MKKLHLRCYLHAHVEFVLCGAVRPSSVLTDCTKRRNKTDLQWYSLPNRTSSRGSISPMQQILKIT